MMKPKINFNTKTISLTPSHHGIKMWLDEGGRLFLSDPSRFELDYQMMIRSGQTYPMQPSHSESFLLPLANGAIRFDYRITVKNERIFEAVAMLSADELKQSQLIWWSDAIGLHQIAT